MKPRVGGALRICIDDEGVEIVVTGRYLVLDSPNRLQFTWHCTAWDPDAPESIVTVLLEPHGADETLMTVHHAHLPPGLVERHEHGWAEIAEQIGTRLAVGL